MSNSFLDCHVIELAPPEKSLELDFFLDDALRIEGKIDIGWFLFKHFGPTFRILLMLL
jgi:hypothetical protein